MRERCSKCKRGRTVFISDYREIMQAARAEKDSPEQLEGQVRRLGVERVFAVQKRRHGLGRSRYRTLPRVSIGVYLNILVVNVRQITRLLVAQERSGVREIGAPRLLAAAL